MEYAGIKCLTVQAIIDAYVSKQVTWSDAAKAIAWLQSGAAAMGTRCRAAERVAAAVYE